MDSGLLAEGITWLSGRDADLARVVERHGPPPLWPRDPGFQTLIRIILEQQVTLSSGEAAFGRLERAAGRVEPEAIVTLGEDGARAAGLTRQKARHVVALSRAVLDRSLDLAAIDIAGDDDARATLLAVPGIGPWTIDVYLLMALRRPDAWPTADIALASSAQFVKRLPRRPTFAELDLMAETWRPWRAAAARLLWHSYLSGDRPRPTNGRAA
jgi:DNA-3-methyladenine glycosylase II